MAPRKCGRECSEFRQTRASRTRGASSGDSGFQCSSAKYPRAGRQQDRSKRRQASLCMAAISVKTVGKPCRSVRRCYAGAVSLLCVVFTHGERNLCSGS